MATISPAELPTVAVTAEEYLADPDRYEQTVKASTEAVRPEALMRLTELGGDDV